MVKRTEKGIIEAPHIPINIPKTSQWLAGQGCGSWFHISNADNNSYRIKRYSPNGILEFDSIFNKVGDADFCLDCPYAFTYLSHYKQCNIIQHGETITFVNIKNQ